MSTSTTTRKPATKKSAKATPAKAKPTTPVKPADKPSRKRFPADGEYVFCAHCNLERQIAMPTIVKGRNGATDRTGNWWVRVDGSVAARCQRCMRERAETVKNAKEAGKKPVAAADWKPSFYGKSGHEGARKPRKAARQK
jgi:hypothetical protein